MTFKNFLPRMQTALTYTIVCLFFSCSCLRTALGSVILSTGIIPNSINPNTINSTKFPIATPEEVAFDNLDLLPQSVTGFRGDTGDILAQPFLLGAHTGISRVELQLDIVGRPVGQITVELWDDDGSGQPGSRVAEIGSVSDRIPFAPTKLSFDAIINGLTPNQPYYVALSFLNATADFSTNSVGWDLVGSHDGAAPGLILVDFLEGQPVARQWREVGASAVGTQFEHLVDSFAMRVVAVPEPCMLSLALAAAIARMSLRRSPRRVFSS